MHSRRFTGELFQSVFPCPVNIDNLLLFYVNDFSDLLMCILCGSFTPASALLESWLFGEVLCHIVPMALVMCVYVSTFTCAAIAEYRYGRTMGTKVQSSVYCFLPQLIIRLDNTKFFFPNFSGKNWAIWAIGQWWWKAVNQAQKFCFGGTT